MNSALIFAGGVGSRMHTNGTPKQFLNVHGKPIIVYTIEHFQNHPDIDRIVVVCIETYINYMCKLVELYKLSKVFAVVPGGETGQDSIWQGLSKLLETSDDDREIVLIHDGVRPLIDASLISRNIESVKTHGSAISASPAIETFCLRSTGETIAAVLERDKCFLAKAPQSFFLKDIVHCHRAARREGAYRAVDSAQLMMRNGFTLHYVLCDTSNIKITTPCDYYVFKGILEANENMQIMGL